MKYSLLILSFLLVLNVPCLADNPAAKSLVAATAPQGEVDFIASPQLWNPNPKYKLGDPKIRLYDGSFEFKKGTLKIFLDQAQVGDCGSGEHQGNGDNGWICNTPVNAGEHVFAVEFDDKNDQHYKLSATLNLEPKKRKSEPGDMTGGYWCVSMTMSRLALMPVSDRRCHSD